jgi:N-lysine methyltransferase SETD6
MYHIMGSRILSRSFQVERWVGEEANENSKANTSAGSAMDVDDPHEGADLDIEALEESTEEEEDDAEDPSNVAMVPMADILNARYGSENVSPFSPLSYFGIEWGV